MRIVAFTAAFGHRAPPHIQPIGPDIPLVCFTDRPGLKVSGYDVRPVALPFSSPRLRSKYVKVMAHAMFPGVDWAIWFDASIVFKTGQLTRLVHAAAGASIAIHRHAVRSCVYDEAEVCKQAGLDDATRIDAQMARYRQAGHPVGAGLWENGVIVRRLADARVVELNEAWWTEITRGSIRDQLSLPVVLRQLGITVQPLAGCVYDDPFASVVPGPMSRPAIGMRERLRRRWFPGDVLAAPQPLLFDNAFYLASNPDVAMAGVGLFEHYVTFGGREGRAPHVLFDSRSYLAAHGDACREAGGSPLDHYLAVGWRRGWDPHPLFDVSFYLEANPDVARAGVEPLTHYVQVGGRERRDPHVLFDTSWYLAEYGDACRHAPGGALGHYLTTGWRAGARPNRWFHVPGYQQRYRDVAASGIEPLGHYLRHGIGEGRDAQGAPTG
jgi:hypothetical protein